MYPVDAPGTPAARLAVVPDQGTFVVNRAPRAPGLIGALFRRASSEDTRATAIAARVARAGVEHAPVPMLRDVMESGVTMEELLRHGATPTQLRMVGIGTVEAVELGVVMRTAEAASTERKAPGDTLSF